MLLVALLRESVYCTEHMDNDSNRFTSFLCTLHRRIKKWGSGWGSEWDVHLIPNSWFQAQQLLGEEFARERHPTHIQRYSLFQWDLAREKRIGFNNREAATEVKQQSAAGKPSCGSCVLFLCPFPSSANHQVQTQPNGWDLGLGSGVQCQAARGGGDTVWTIFPPVKSFLKIRLFFKHGRNQHHPKISFFPLELIFLFTMFKTKVLLHGDWYNPWSCCTIFHSHHLPHWSGIAAVKWGNNIGWVLMDLSMHIWIFHMQLLHSPASTWGHNTSEFIHF